MPIVVFNGQPQCGKDTVSRMLVEHMDSRILVPAIESSLSLPLRKIAYAMTGYLGDLEGDNYEKFKRQQFPEFNDDTGRQILINVSERFLKPVYGEGVMARLWVARVLKSAGPIYLIRDGGFRVEIDVLLSEVGWQNLYVVRVHREGCDFDGDSRERINHPISGHNMDLWNNGSLDDLRTEAGRIYGRLVNQLGWKL